MWPSLYLISDVERVGEARFLDVLSRSLDADLPMLLVREPKTEFDDLRRLLDKVLQLNADRAQVLVSCRLESSRERLGCVGEFGLAGVHLGAAKPSHVQEARVELGEGAWLGYSAHDASDARAARSAGCDYVSLSPVFAPKSKSSDHPPMGLDSLRSACDSVAGPVYGLGGIAASNVLDVRSCGVAGVAVIGGILDVENPDEATRALLDQ